ncbi:hypothetical protein KUIN1_22090 [Pseudomonas sp. KUIN-1]|nr:hypothetical protein KUIN1_22090 [Pseudomonas sp. KUIN-1]
MAIQRPAHQSFGTGDVLQQQLAGHRQDNLIVPFGVTACVRLCAIVKDDIASALPGLPVVLHDKRVGTQREREEEVIAFPVLLQAPVMQGG